MALATRAGFGGIIIICAISNLWVMEFLSKIFFNVGEILIILLLSRHMKVIINVLTLIRI